MLLIRLKKEKKTTFLAPKNIVKAIQTAQKLKIYCISLTGFKGGLSKKIADVNLHIASQNYGIVESLHHALMNIISQFIKWNLTCRF